MLLWTNMPAGIAQIRVGISLQGRPIILHAAFDPDDRDALSRDPTGTLLIGGTHGDERATVALLDSFLASRPGRHRETAFAVLSLHNPDGHEADTRYNGRGVDLNRNFPYRWSPSSDEPPGAEPLSEPEARILHDLIQEFRPRKIVSLHWALGEIDADGPQSAALAARMWEALTPEERLPYRLKLNLPGQESTGFCPGSLGQWCGNQLVYPDGIQPAMVTLELPYHPRREPRSESLPSGHLDEVRSLWRQDPAAYLAGVEGPVHRMLDAACRLPHAWPGRDDRK